MKLASKLSQVYAAGSVRKRGRNPHFGYDYVMADDVYESVRRKLAELKVFLFHSIDSVERREIRMRGGVGVVTVVDVTLTFADGESDETFSVKWRGEAFDNEDKGIQKAATSAVKYALMKLFLISGGEDDPDAGPEIVPAKPQPAETVAARPSPNPDAALREGGRILKQVVTDRKDQEILKEILREKGIPMATFSQMVGEKALDGYEMDYRSVFDLADMLGDYSKPEEDPFA